MRIHDLDTPSLLLDVNAHERNLKKLQDLCKGTPARPRPHFKNHKCPTIAKRQLKLGAVGITCAKIGEAEVLADNGIEDILVANQIVGEEKLVRLAKLARRAKIMVAVDDVAQIELLKKVDANLGVLVEVECGHGRCGLREPEKLVQLATRIAETKNLKFEGIQSYEGHATYVDDHEKRRAMVTEALAIINAARDALLAAKLPVNRLSGASTSTAPIMLDLGGMTELQAGTYATMDWRYHQLAPQFEVAMTMLARVVSSTRGGLAVVDVGSKGMGNDYGPVKIKNHDHLATKINEEHTILTGDSDLKIGDLVEVLPSHACTTCNLHRELVVHDAGKVIDRWAIEASGRLM